MGTAAAAKGWSGAMHNVRVFPAMVTPDSRSWFWWGEHMDDELAIRLIREIEVEKGRLATHEGVCAERYRNIEKTLGSFETKLDAVLTRAAANTPNMPPWLIWLLGIAAAGLVAVTSWSLGQVYELQTKPPVVAAAKR